MVVWYLADFCQKRKRELVIVSNRIIQVWGGGMSIHSKDQERTEFCDGAFRLLLFKNLRKLIHSLLTLHVHIEKYLSLHRYRYKCRLYPTVTVGCIFYRLVNWPIRTIKRRRKRPGRIYLFKCWYERIFPCFYYFIRVDILEHLKFPPK